MAEFNVLVVCLGNICRSPLAERVLTLRLQELMGAESASIHVSSAGVRAMVGSPMDADAAAQLQRLGGDPAGFVSTQLTVEACNDADLVLTATQELRSRVLEDAPRALKRTFTIRELATIARSEVLLDRAAASGADFVRRSASWRGSTEVADFDVPDPIGRPEEFHREVADLLDRECRSIATALAQAWSPNPL
ncbi:MAG: hypothetical protein ABI776_03930 [Nocardioidaceae bacterium]